MRLAQLPLASLVLAAMLAAAPDMAAAQGRGFDCRAGLEEQQAAQAEYDRMLASFKKARKQVDDIRADFDRRLLAATQNGTRILTAAQGQPYDQQWERIRALEARMQAYLPGLYKAADAACTATEVFTEPGGRGATCYMKSKLEETRIDICIGVYGMRQEEAQRPEPPESWRHDFRYQR